MRHLFEFFSACAKAPEVGEQRTGIHSDPVLRAMGRAILLITSRLFVTYTQRRVSSFLVWCSPQIQVMLHMHRRSNVSAMGHISQTQTGSLRIMYSL